MAKEHSLADDPWVTPVQRFGFMDYTRTGWRMFWQFWYADGSSMGTYNPKLGFKLTERMMKAGLIPPFLGDAERAAARREEVNAR